LGAGLWFECCVFLLQIIEVFSAKKSNRIAAEGNNNGEIG
jgi:hypothetical protein